MTKNTGQGANARFGYAQSGTKQPYFYYVFLPVYALLRLRLF